MVRPLLFLVCVMAGCIGVSSTQNLTAQSKTSAKGIKLGEPFEGELGGKEVGMNQLLPKGVFQFNPSGFAARIPITLKAGQDLTVTVSVKGSGRNVAIAMIDPAGKLAGHALHEEKTAVLQVDEINAKGQYTIIIHSEKIGPFTVRATSSAMEDDEKALEEKIKQRRKELEELEAKLKALRDKKK